jgi:hypothetical protein
MREGGDMTVYYRGRDLLITHEVFEVLAPPRRAFPISELRDAYIVQGSDGRGATVLARTAQAVAALLAVALPLLDGSVQALVVIGLIASGAVLTGACLRDTLQPHELWAVYNGREVKLFHGTDREKFGQVRRALLRALEDDAGV